VPLEFVPRRLQIREVVDCRLKPVHIDWFLRRPLVRRGSVLIVANDLDLKAVRKFWPEARVGCELPSYRLGLYDPSCPAELIDWVGRPYRPSAKERLRMRRDILRFKQYLREHPATRLRMAVYPVED
jgi:hypothetical protein